MVHPPAGATLTAEGHRTIFLPADPEQPMKVTGLAGMTVNLGGKNILLSVGHVQFDQLTGEVVFEAGRNPLPEGHWEEFCAALS